MTVVIWPTIRIFGIGSCWQRDDSQSIVQIAGVELKPRVGTGQLTLVRAVCAHVRADRIFLMICCMICLQCILIIRTFIKLLKLEEIKAIIKKLFKFCIP